MASYPQPTENLGIFDSNVFNTQTDTTGLIKFPDGSQQTSAYTGAKSLAGTYLSTNMTIDANGKITALSNGSGGGGGSQNLSTTLQIGNSAGLFNINMNNNQLQNVNTVAFADTTSQTSAYTGGKAFVGSYTNANITLDAAGKITGLSNGTVTLPNLSQTLGVGNSAGIYNIDMNNNQLQNVSQITASANLTLNPTTKTISAKNMDMSGNQIQNVNTVGFADATSQTSAYTGAKLLAGSYTNTNMTIDAAGKITALSNGSGGGGGSQTLAQTLQLGNSAGIYNIDMSGNQLQNVSQITASADLTLNPTGSIVCTGKTIDITNGVIHNCPLIDSQNNQNITIEGKGTGIVILKGNNANTQIQSTGLTSTPTLQVQDMTTTREVDIYTNSTASNQNPIVQLNDTTIIGKGTTLTNGVIDIATNSATTSGVRITNNTALIGAGGTSATPSYYFQSDASNNINNINGNTKITGNCEITGTITGNITQTPLYGGYNYGLTGNFFYTMAGIGTNLSAGNFISNTILFSPFFIGKSVTITALGMRQGGTLTGTVFPTLSIGLYTNNDGYPLTKLCDISVNMAATTGVLSGSVSSVVVPRGYYWTALHNNSGTSYQTNSLKALTIQSMYSLPEVNSIIDFTSAVQGIVTFSYTLNQPNTLPTTITQSSLTRRLPSVTEMPLIGIQTA